MIKDAKGRKWSMRFEQWQQGWHWDARWKGIGQTSGMRFFKTKARAEADAQRVIQSFDAVAYSAELWQPLATQARQRMPTDRR